jgi:hypothetical protein
MTTAERLDVLDTQQALLTDGITQMLRGAWVGFPSLQVDLEALSPGIQIDPHPPLLTSQAGPPTPPWWLAEYNPNEYMPPQQASWSCSACALAWVLRATRVDPGASEQSAIAAIGYPNNINPTYGLMDASGPALRAVYTTYGVPTLQGWLTFDQVWTLAGYTTGQMSGGAWYHWVGIRGRSGNDLAIANSAEGYKNVYSTLSREQFNALGPFSVVELG